MPQKNNTYLSRTLSPYLVNKSLSAGKQGLIKAITGDVPEMKFDIVLPDDTKKSLYLVAGMIGGGFALNGIFNYISRK